MLQNRAAHEDAGAGSSSKLCLICVVFNSHFFRFIAEIPTAKDRNTVIIVGEGRGRFGSRAANFENVMAHIVFQTSTLIRHRGKESRNKSHANPASD